MGGSSVDGLTLRQKFIDAGKLMRELSDHLDRNLRTRARDLRRLAKQGRSDLDGDEVKDVSIRSAVRRLCESDDYSRQTYVKVNEYLESIQRDVKKLAEGE